MKDNNSTINSMNVLGYTLYSNSELGIVFKDNNADNSTFDHMRFFKDWNDVEKFIGENN